MPEVSLIREGGFARVRPTTFLGGKLWESYRQATAGARYDRTRRINLAPLDKVPGILTRLRRSGFGVKMDPELRTELQKRTAEQWMQLQAVRERIDSIGREFETRTGNRFFPYQHTGAVWLAMKHTCLLADDMGLGKTMQSIVAIPSGAPTLVVCPASIKGVWKAEVEMWRPHVKVTQLSGRGSFRWPKHGEMVVVNYDVLPLVHDQRKCDGFLPPEPCEGCEERVSYNGNGVAIKDTKGHATNCNGFKERERCPGCHPMLDEVEEGTVGIGDEVHKVKHATAKRTVSFRALFEAIRRRGGRTWGLTGTPVQNSPQELWSLLVALGAAHEAYGSWKEFLRLANARPKTFGRGSAERSYGFEWGDPDDEFVDRLRRVSLRRMKRDVLPQLPTKLPPQRIVVDVDKASIRRCDQLLKRRGRTEDLEALLDAGKGAAFEELATLRRALASAKVPALLKLLEEYEEAGEPVVVFSMHREPIDLIGRREGWGTFTGGVDPSKRSKVVERFQAGELKGLACTIQAAGEGITLTRSNQMVFVDLSYKPTENEQAEDRLVRIGQTRGVMIRILEADHPIDRRVNDILLKKRRIIATSVDASKVTEDAIRGASSTISAFESELKKVQEEVACGRAVRRMAENEAEKRALEALHSLEFEGSDERVALDLAEQAELIGLSDKQWDLAVRLASLGREPEDESGSEGDQISVRSRSVPCDDEATEEVGVGCVLHAGSGDGAPSVADLRASFEVGGAVMAASDPLDPIMKAIFELTDEQRRSLFEELEDVYCVRCGEDLPEADDEDHECEYEDEEEDDV